MARRIAIILVIAGVALAAFGTFLFLSQPASQSVKTASAPAPDGTAFERTDRLSRHSSPGNGSFDFRKYAQSSSKRVGTASARRRTPAATHRSSSRAEIAMQLARSLKPASLAFNAPERLQLEESTTVELVIAPGGTPEAAATALSSGLAGSTVSEMSAYSMTMEARLSGEDFEISSPVQRKLVLPDQSPPRWSWTVKPTVAGLKKKLRLEVNAILDDGTRELAPFSLRTFNHDIEVEVTLMKRLLGTLKEADSAIAAASTVGGAFMALFGWIVARRSRKQA